MRSIRPFIPPVAVGAVATLALLVIVDLSWTARTQAAPAQPMPFPHVRMVQAGVQCVFCHTTVTKGPAAGIPSVEKCMGCHRIIAPDRPAIQQLAGFYQRQQPIPWQRVVQMPDFVHFPHYVHVGAGLNCENCHGDVGHMDVTHQVTNMNMGWCLDCHEKQPNAQQLKDCVICHY